MNDRLLYVKNLAKKVLSLLPFTLTQNQRYDRETARVIRLVCRPDSNCVDVGAHRGEILELMRGAAPRGHHFGFEPLPHLYGKLRHRYVGVPEVHIFPYALAEAAGSSPFNWVKTNPAYSGLERRQYDRPNEQDETITVETKRLDDVLLSYGLPVHLLKIDVEGGEMGVLRGATEVLRRHRPVVVFEFGLGGSDVYGTTPEMLWEFFAAHGYQVSLMERYLAGAPAFTLAELSDQFHQRKNYYFIAYPA